MSIDPKWLTKEQFTIAVDYLPLVSIDLCMVHEKRILLGKRNNRPAKNWWFTPGGRIKKNEAVSSAIMRIFMEECNYLYVQKKSLTLMGAWDHFYNESAFDENLVTHYINLPHYFPISQQTKDGLNLPTGFEEQHSDWTWMPLNEAANHPKVHQYVRQYASWLLNNL